MELTPASEATPSRRDVRQRIVEAKIIAGRRFHTGLKELIVGKDAAREFAQTSIASTVELDGEPWKVAIDALAGW